MSPKTSGTQTARFAVGGQLSIKRWPAPQVYEGVRRPPRAPMGKLAFPGAGRVRYYARGWKPEKACLWAKKRMNQQIALCVCTKAPPSGRIGTRRNAFVDGTVDTEEEFGLVMGSLTTAAKDMHLTGEPQV